ncbi:MAG TPA: hypothetical protein VL307_08245 [Chitinophagaceae bacterium]|nr:hypothetical protein [Chitinophagaceae bacterium]
MKKVLSITVAFLYLAITSGLVLQIHYCMGREIGSSVSLADTGTHACSKCGMENAKNKCCHDEVKFLKLQDVHQQVTADFIVAAPVAVTADPFTMVDELFLERNSNTPVCNNSPPADDGQPAIFLLHRVFRI